jgi:hypothetical protein
MLSAIALIDRSNSRLLSRRESSALLAPPRADPFKCMVIIFKFIKINYKMLLFEMTSIKTLV